jgi:phosphocarrier protein
MTRREVVLKNRSGLHARPASEFVAAAKKFSSKVTIRNVSADKAAANAKSVIRILAEGMAVGTRMEIAADGPDEQEAADTLAALVESGFGEE